MSVILLKVLSMIGIILLAILGLFLLLLLLVLFFPIVYRIDGEKMSEQMEWNIRVSWLFGFVRGIAEYQDKFALKIKLLFITIYRNEEKHSKNIRTGFDKVEGSVSNKSDTTSSNPQKAVAKQSDANKADQLETVSIEEQNRNSEKNGAGFHTKTEKIKYKIHSTYDKINTIVANIEYYKSVLEDKDTHLLLQDAWGILGKLWKALKPQKCRADIIFGTGSPDTTGYALGVYGILSPHLGRKVVVTPVFSQAILEGKVEMVGRVIVFTVLVQALKIFFDQRYKQFIHKMKRDGQTLKGKAGA